MIENENMTLNAQQYKDALFLNSQKIDEYRLMMKQDLKRAKFRSEKHIIRMTQGDELRDMCAKAQVEQQSLRLRYEASLKALKERQKEEIEALSDPSEIATLKLVHEEEYNNFIGRDDKVLKVKNKVQLAELKNEQKEETKAFEQKRDEELSPLSGDEYKTRQKELKDEYQALKKKQKHDVALLVMKQRQAYNLCSFSINKKRSHRSSVKRNRALVNSGIYVILVCMSFLWLLPFVFIVLQSLRTEAYHGVSGYLFLIERTYDEAGNVISRHFYLGFDNYVALFNTSDNNFLRWYLNTFIIAICTALGQMIFVLLVAYGLSRLRFKGRRTLMNIMLVLGMFPGFLTMIILYWLLSDMGLTQTGAVGGLILVGIASSGMGYYVCKGYFDTIPKSLDEAARIDGATRAGVLVKVIIPMSRPIIIYVVLTAFMGPWADYIFASYIAFGESSSYNVAVGLYSWLTKDQINSKYTEFCAGGVLVAIPVTVLFMSLQRFYVEGVTGGAVKG